MANSPNPSSRGGGHNSNPRDWLKDLDSKAQGLHPARSWLEYPYFMLARYPALEPAVSSDHPDSRMLDVSRRQFCQTLDDEEARIVCHEKGSFILQGLTPDQRRQLAALIFDCVTDFKKHGEGAEYGKRLTRLTKEAQSRQRRLDKLVAKLREDLKRLLEYCTKLDPWIGANHRKFAENQLSAMERLQHYQQIDQWEQDRRTYRNFAKNAGFSPFPDDPTTSSIAQLHCFFHSGCGLSRNESEIRAAMVREACFSSWKKPVRIVHHHPTFDAEPRGAAAVAQAVRRFRPQH